MGSFIPITTNAFKSSMGTELCDMMPTEGVTSSSVLNKEGYLCLPIKHGTNLKVIHSSPSSRVENLLLNGATTLLSAKDVQQIHDVSLRDALHLLVNILDKDSDGLMYGAMFSSNGVFLHLTHFVIATALSKRMYDDLLTLDSIGTLTIFPFKQGRKNVYNKAKDESLAPCFLSVIQALESNVVYPNVTTKRDCADARIHKEVHLGNYSYNVPLNSSTNLSTDSEILIPIQFVSDGLLVPYYGLVLSKGGNGNSYKSRQVGYISSGNIRAGLEGGSNNYNDTCTGDNPNNMFSSLYSLNIMNYNSMFNKSLLATGWETQVYVSQYISCMVYKQMLSVPLEEPTPTEIPDEILKQYPDSTLMVNNTAYKLGSVADISRLFKGRYAIHIPSKTVIEILGRDKETVSITTVDGGTTSCSINELISIIKI